MSPYNPPGGFDNFLPPPVSLIQHPTEYLPADTRDPLSAPRSEDFFVEHLDIDENIIGVLDGVSGGSVEANANRSKTRSGVVYLEKPANIAWGRDRLRIWKTMTALGQTWEEPLGTFVISSPGQNFHGAGISREIELIDKIEVLEEDAIEKTFVVNPGELVTDVVRDLILDSGETNISMTQSDATVPFTREWRTGTPRLRIINDLLTSISYWALFTDRMGAFRIAPYQPPRNRPIHYHFREGAESIHLPEWSLTQDLHKVPNRVILTSREDDDGNVLEAIASNTNPDSPTSYQARGNRWRVLSEDSVETDNLTTLQAMAQRRLLDNSSPPTAIELSHAWIPDLDLNDAVMLHSQGYEGLCTVTTMTIDLEPGTLVSAQWREVPNI